MSTPPAPPEDQELFDLAARLVGVQTVDLLHAVRRADGSLVVILCTGQKYVFDPEQIVSQLGADIETLIRAQLAPPPKAKPKK